MIELLAQIIKLLEQVPSNVAIIAFGFIMIFMLRRQEAINGENDRKFRSGASNFQMIDNHFLKISEHFNKMHKEIQDVTVNFDKRMDLLEKMILKDIIYNDSIDITERQEAYERYIQVGGNGQTEMFYEKRIRPLLEERFLKK